MATEKKSGFKGTLEPLQTEITKEVENYLKETHNKNFFISLRQGAGKTIIALNILSELKNKGVVKKALVLIPRSNLVGHWAKECNKMFFGLSIIANPTLSKKGIEKILPQVHNNEVDGFATTIQSFRNFVRKGYIQEKDFDIVIVDEASDLVVAKDFFEKFRMSNYASGLEQWNKTIKLFLMPHQVREDKIEALTNRFGSKITKVIRKEVTSDSGRLTYNVHDPLIVDDAYVNEFVEVIQGFYSDTRRKVVRFLKQKRIKGFEENLETLVSPYLIARLKKNYGLTDTDINLLNTLISKYILFKHIKNWFLYSNREDIGRSILAEQVNVSRWLKQEDKKLAILIQLLKEQLKEEKKIFIYSQYVSLAKFLFNLIKKELGLTDNEIYVVTGEDQDDQSDKLERFIEEGKILIATPVFDKGTDIGGKIVGKKAVILFTPPYNKDNLLQVAGRIRGGDVYTLAYRGFEEDQLTPIVEMLKEKFMKEVKK